MNYLRNYKGKGKGQEVHNVEEVNQGYNNNGQETQTPQQNPAGSHLNNLESKGGWRQVLCNRETKNRFSVLTKSKEEEE